MAFGTDTVCCEGIKKAIPVKQDRKQQEARASCCLFHVKIRFRFFFHYTRVGCGCKPFSDNAAIARKLCTLMTCSILHASASATD